jgi:hypothetical protein
LCVLLPALVYLRFVRASKHTHTHTHKTCWLLVSTVGGRRRLSMNRFCRPAAGVAPSMV